MRCKTFQQLIYLNRPGELTPGQESQLQAHLDDCLQCRQEYPKALQLRNIIASLRSVQPMQNDPDSVKDQVIDQISQASTAFDYFREKRRRLGWVMISAAVIILLTFVSQEMMMYHRIARLERQMAEQSRIPFYETSGKRIHLSGMESWFETQQQESAKKIFNTTERTLIIRESDYKQLIREIRQTRLMNRMLLDMLGQDSTVWQEVRFEDGVNPTELWRLYNLEKRLKRTGRLPVEVKQ